MDARTLGIIIGIVLMTLMLAGCCYGFFSEKKSWNNGVCADCQTPWENFDMDSQGGRGYKCRCLGFHHTWISWPVDKLKQKRGTQNG
jgi:hypothetical protein